MDIKIIFLGTGTPNPDPFRSGPSLAIIVEDNVYLFDAGVNVIRQSQLAKKKYNLKELDVKNLDKVFITHLHSDHTLGLNDLILTPWILGRKNHLKLYGPRGISEMSANILKTYKIDIEGRLDGLEPINDSGYKVDSKEIEEGVIYKDEYVNIKAFMVNHMPFEAYGYRVEVGDKVIVISGDTAPNQNLIDNAKNCDILIHEVFSSTGIKSRNMDWVVYHGSVHTSSIDLGKICKSIKPKKLILYHQLFMIDLEKDEKLLEEREKEMINQIRQNYDGKIYSAKDIDLYELTAI